MPLAATASAPLHKTADPQLLLKLLRIEGYCVLPQRLTSAQLERLRSAAAPLIAAAQPPPDHGFRDHRLNFSVEHDDAFLDHRIWGTPEVLDPVCALLGSDACLSKMILDSNLPGSGYQPSHMDVPYLYPESAVALGPHSIVLTIPLVDVAEDMGPMEMWPCTQGNTRDIDQDEVIPYLHGVRFCMPAGSLLLRDARTWHRGTPNRSRHPRPQVSYSFHRRWYAGPHVGVPAAQHDALPARARALIERRG